MDNIVRESQKLLILKHNMIIKNLVLDIRIVDSQVEIQSTGFLIKSCTG